MILKEITKRSICDDVLNGYTKKYDLKGNLIYLSSQNPYKKSTYVYDEQNRIVKETAEECVNEQQYVVFEIIHKYNMGGYRIIKNKIKTIEIVGFDESVLETFSPISITDVIIVDDKINSKKTTDFETNNIQEVEYKYDGENIITERFTDYLTGEIIETEYCYSEGLIQSKSVIDQKGGNLLDKWVYLYDNENRLIEKQYVTTDDYGQVAKYIYKKGEIIELSFDEHGDGYYLDKISIKKSSLAGENSIIITQDNLSYSDQQVILDIQTGKIKNKVTGAEVILEGTLIDAPRIIQVFESTFFDFDENGKRNNRWRSMMEMKVFGDQIELISVTHFQYYENDQ